MFFSLNNRINSAISAWLSVQERGVIFPTG